MNFINEYEFAEEHCSEKNKIQDTDNIKKYNDCDYDGTSCLFISSVYWKNNK